MSDKHSTKWCIISLIMKGDGTSYWGINLVPPTACLDDFFSFGLPLRWEFETEDAAYDFAVKQIDPWMDAALEPDNEWDA